MKTRFIFSTILWLALFQGVYGQFYHTGQPPASVKWQQLNTPNFQIVYPESFSQQAKIVAGLLEESRDLTGHTLNHQPAKIPVIIHNHSTRSNGLVVWAPKRMEIYPVPPQQPRGGDWLTQLAVHEQRHVTQVDKLNTGNTGLLYHLLGEQATGIAAGRLPIWFLEGDAVTAETTLTLAGRGRSASFNMPIGAILQTIDDQYSYDKFLLGSYRDYVPDHYRYGFLMVSSLRDEYGPEIWENTVDYVGNWPLHPAPLPLALKRQTGSGPGRLHNKVLERAKERWDSLHINRHAENYKSLNSRTSSLYHSYRHPSWLADTAVIARKSGIGQIDQLVVLDMEGREQIIHSPGTFSSPSLTVSGSRIAWSEYQPHVRWGLKNYSVIRIFDLNTGRVTTPRQETRYFSPAFAPDGLFIAVISIELDNSQYIEILNSVTGETVASYPAPENTSVKLPVYHPDGDRIFFTSSCQKGMSIVFLDLVSGKWEQLFEPLLVNLSSPFFYRDQLCFGSDISGRDELYIYNKNTGISRPLTSSKFGAFDGDISICRGKMAWSTYTADGYDLTIAPLSAVNPTIPADLAGTGGHSKVHPAESCGRLVDKTSDIQTGKIAARPMNQLIDNLVNDEKGLVTGRITPDPEWSVKPYKKGLNLFNFHSWSPFYFDYNEFNLEELPIYPGLTLLSQNLLNTANTFLGYSYRGGRHITHGTFKYSGWYPVLETGFDYGAKPLVFGINESNDHDPGINDKRLNVRIKTYIPFNFSSGGYVAGLEPGLKLHYDNALFIGENSQVKGMTLFDTYFTAYRYIRMSHRDLAPSWGQVFRWRRRSSPFESYNMGSINAAELSLYTPGFFPHHSFRFDASIQRQRPLQYFYSGLVKFPRGYSQEVSEELNMVRSSYKFPFLYPELSLSWIAYIKRLHAEIFMDYGINRYHVLDSDMVRPEWKEDELFSWGAAVTVNYHILRILFPFNTSAGFARMPGRDETTYFFSLGLNPDIF